MSNPTDGANCPGVSGFWSVSTAEQNYLHTASSSVFVNSYNQTLYIAGRGISPIQWYYFSNCTKNYSSTLADQGWVYGPIITNSTDGVFSPNVINYCKTNYSSGQQFLQPYSGLSIKTIY